MRFMLVFALAALALFPLRQALACDGKPCLNKEHRIHIDLNHLRNNRSIAVTSVRTYVPDARRSDSRVKMDVGVNSPVERDGIKGDDVREQAEMSVMASPDLEYNSNLNTGHVAPEPEVMPRGPGVWEPKPSPTVVNNLRSLGTGCR